MQRVQDFEDLAELEDTVGIPPRCTPACLDLPLVLQARALLKSQPSAPAHCSVVTEMAQSLVLFLVYTLVGHLTGSPQAMKRTPLRKAAASCADTSKQTSDILD